jgi:hypothetical protein
MALGIKIMVWNRYKNVSGVNWLVGSQPPHLDNCIYSGNVYIYKTNEKENPAQIRFNYYNKDSYMNTASLDYS